LIFYKYQIIRCIEGFIDIIGTTNVSVSCSISFLYFDKVLFALDFYSLNKIFSLFSYSCFLALWYYQPPPHHPHTHILLQPKKSRILVLRFTQMKGMWRKCHLILSKSLFKYLKCFWTVCLSLCSANINVCIFLPVIHVHICILIRLSWIYYQNKYISTNDSWCTELLLKRCPVFFSSKCENVSKFLSRRASFLGNPVCN